jgi:deoxyribonuclease-4
MERPMTPVSSKILFGTAGVPHSSSGQSTVSGIETIHKLGLDCLEIMFVKGVKMGHDTAHKIRQKASELGVSISAHAPYYINLNSPERGIRLAGQEQLLNSARLAALCGAKNIIFHAGYYGMFTPEKTFDTIEHSLKEIVSILRSERNFITLRVETMGKRSQFGSLEEVLFLCRDIEGVLPCLDFSHMLAREGAANSYLHFHRTLKKLERKLGRAAVKNIHIHVSGIHYGAKGELKHLNFQESSFRYDDWIQALRDAEAEGTVICESPNLETDALMLKNLYESYSIKTV